MTTDDKITRLLDRERGYVNNPADKGGPTNWGITQRKLSGVLGRPATIEDVRNLTAAQAREIYRHDFETMCIAAAPDVVEDMLLDIVENHGPGNGVRILQRALNATLGLSLLIDGVAGDKTRAALAAVTDGGKLYRELGADRMEFTGRCITKNLRDDDHDGIPDNTEFAWGWLVRQAAFWRATP